MTDQPNAGAASEAAADPERADDPQIRFEGGYYRCGRCGTTTKGKPNRCDVCLFSGRPLGTFTEVEVAFPAEVSKEALQRDTRPVEKHIRNAYTELASLASGGRRSVKLSDLRSELMDVDRETFDAALTKLGMHPDVHLETYGHLRADLNTQMDAIRFGGEWRHRMFIENRPSRAREIADHMIDPKSGGANRQIALSALSSLSEDEVHHVARRSGDHGTGGVEAVRQRLADRAQDSQDAWLADGRQGEADGKLLYRADNEPDWVATWTDEDRKAARAAAKRLLERADRQPSWAYIRERANRWLNA